MKQARRGGYAALVAAGILLSRIAGLVRERVFAHYLGNSDAAGAFRAALRIPNFLQNLFGEGVLSASFIPVYSRLLAEKDEKLAGRVAGIVASLLTLWVSVIVLFGVLLTPWFVDLVAPGFRGELRELTVTIVRILFPGVGLLVISAWCLGVLNSHRKFFLSYVAPVFWNFAMIATLVVCGQLGFARTELAVALAWGTVAGSALQFLVQVPFVFKYARELRFVIEMGLAPVREVFRNLGPVVLSRGVVQLSAYIDGMIASFLGAAAVSGLGYAQTLYLLPIGLFGMSVAAAELPEMSGTVGEASEVAAKLRARLEAGVRKIAFFVIPSVVGFVFLGRLIVSALFQTGEFGDADTLYVWYILLGSTGGLLAATWGRLYSSTFYALRDTRTPLKIAVTRVFLTASFGVILAFPLRPWFAALLYGVLGMPEARGGELALGAVGLTFASGTAGWVEFLLLKRSLSRKIGRVALSGGYLAKLWLAAIGAGLAALGVNEWSGATVTGWLGVAPHIVAAAWALGWFGIVYFGATFALGVPEVRRILQRRSD